MKRNDLIDAFGYVDDKYLTTAESPTEASETEKTVRRIHKKYGSAGKRIIRAAVAAAAIVTLSVAAYAADIFGLRDALMESSDSELQARIDDVDGEEKLVTVQAREISLAGTEGSPEYMAQEEWLLWESAYEASQPEGSAWINDGWVPSDPALANVGNYYMVFNDEMLDKLTEIAAKYSLKLHAELELLPGEFLYTAVNGTLITPYSGYIFEDGSYQVDTDFRGIPVQFLCNKAGTMPATSLSVWNPEENTEYSYTTEQGYTVDIMQLAEMNRTKIFYSDGETFIILNAFFGEEESAKELADAVNFDALCR